MLVFHLRILTKMNLQFLWALMTTLNEQIQPFITKNSSFGKTLFYLYSKSLTVLVDRNGPIVFNVAVCCMRTDKSRRNSGMDSESIYLARSEV